MPRESTLDKAIHARVLKRKGYHQKIHGGEFQRDVPDHFIGYKGKFIALEAKSFEGNPTDGQKRQLRLIQKAGNIAEVCYTVEMVDRIFDCIDRGDVWVHGDYS